MQSTLLTKPISHDLNHSVPRRYTATPSHFENSKVRRSWRGEKMARVVIECVY